ncbi:hypothetical protein EYF80_067638 [Liparis tanakae]|uniref:Uncharacterized protein n=1 Tax=Liparis tanakae TaxID=230148 RepID=A0A4Z2E0K1_9TELE|nr:hypothetical protein EYF80_067638 [Liparis tanakae]
MAKSCCFSQGRTDLDFWRHIYNLFIFQYELTFVPHRKKRAEVSPETERPEEGRTGRSAGPEASDCSHGPTVTLPPGDIALRPSGFEATPALSSKHIS